MTENQWAGKRLGLPQSGQNSLAKVPRRIFALGIDWTIALVISNALMAGDNTATLMVFAGMQWLLIATIGSSFGHLICGMRVAKLGATHVGFLASAIRVAMILLVIPAVVWDNDNRGLHDKLARTVLVLR